MTWQSKVSNIQVGDRVRYSNSFLQSTRATTGELSKMKGTVTETKTVSGKLLCKVQWDGDDEGPKGSLASNLSKVTQRGVAD